MFNLIAIAVTFPLLTYAAYIDLTHKDHQIPNWIWRILMPIGVGLLIIRAAFLTYMEVYMIIYTIGFMIATCYVLRKVKDNQGRPQLGGADIKCFLCLTVLFPLGLTPFWLGLYSITPFIFLSRGPFKRIGRFYPFLPFILGALPFAIITGMILF